ncbi:MAG: biopolymer transporter ExbD [Proteobacteria bacterium]|nr:biopolymer transporter ExbD [Pseudomonadota bacterium]
MAGKRPSKRRHEVESDVELKLIPVMSLLVVLVPMLLQTAVFERTAAVQVNLPSADEVRYLQEPDREALAESLTLALTDEGFLLASGEKKLARVPRAGTEAFDFGGLERELRAAKDRFPAQEALVLLVEDQIRYDDVIRTMDCCRPFFPAVSLADRLVAGPEE